LRVHIFRTVFH